MKRNAAILVIGDEILSGRTREGNAQLLAQSLEQIGIGLGEIRIVGDLASQIIPAVRELSRSYEYVFTSGGIGPTHDDITAEAIAEAVSCPLIQNPEALARLEQYYRESNRELNDSRRKMAQTPQGATLINNPITAAPGFIINNIYVMAGVPKIFQAMMEDIVPTLQSAPVLHEAKRKTQKGEGDIASDLGALAASFPELSIGSYPAFNENLNYSCEIIIRGMNPKQVQEAEAALERILG